MPNVVFDRTRTLEIEVVDRDVASDDPVGTRVFTIQPGSTVEEVSLTDWGGMLRLELR